MKKLVVLSLMAFLLVFGSLSALNAQVLDGIYAKEHVPSRKPVPYKYLREADVMFTKRVWRVIDLREKINHPLYFPTTQLGDRRSLIDLLLWGINTEGLVPYGIADDRFTQPITRNQIEINFGAVNETISFTDENGVDQTSNIKKEIISSEVKQLLIKEDWFFDKQHSTMEVRIIGMCPIRFYVKDEDLGGEEPADIRKSQVFWIYFPEARRVLANHEVFNEYNDAERRTYDDIFFKRKFGSYIAQVTNVYDDRRVNEYTQGLQSLLEAETLKQQLTNYEQDLWEY